MASTNAESDAVYFYAVSNASETIFPTNTLSHFHNILPKMLINTHIKYEVGLSEIMLDAKFKCRVLPEENVPTLILSTQNVPNEGDEINIDYFKNEYPIHVPHQKMTLKKLIMYLYTYQSEISGRIKRPYILSWVKNRRQYCFGCFDTLKGAFTADPRAYKLYVHQVFHDFIHADEAEQAADNCLGERIINGQPYIVYEYEATTKIFFTCNIDWFMLPSFYKPTMFVETNCIDAQVFNEKLKKHIGFCNVPNNDFTQEITYFYKEFEAIQFYPLKLANFEKLEIKLVDEDSNQLRLLPGRATLLKFILRPVRSKMDVRRHYINVSSKKEAGAGDANTESSFKVQLPRPLNLYGQWKVTILSAIFPSQFQLELGQRERILVVQVFPDGEDMIKYVLELPNVNSTEEIANFIEHETNYSIQVDIDATTGGLSVKSKLRAKYVLRSSLFYFLGGIKATLQPDKIMTFERQKNNAFTFHRPPRFEEHWPSNVFIYADFIKHSIVGGELMKTLKIIPIVAHNIVKNTYLQHEWKTLEWHRLNNTVIHTLNFELRDQTGALIKFNNKSTDENYTWFKLVLQKDE